MRQIILDTETTGLRPEDGHRVIEIGCIEMVDRKLTKRHFHHYINPQCEVEAGALAVHGITNDFLKDKPVFNDIVQDFIRFIQGAELIIHNAPFDVAFLNHELSLLPNPHPPVTDICSVFDTLVLARKLHVGQRNSLDALCKRYAIDNSQREWHGALLDATILAQVYLAMTGGQSSLFESADGSSENSQATGGARISRVKSHQATVLRASAEEVADHNAYMAALTD